MEMNKTLADLRKGIDEIDEKIVRLLSERMELVKEVGKLKKELNLSPKDPVREKEIIHRLTKSAGGLLSRSQIGQIFRSIFNATKRVQE